MAARDRNKKPKSGAALAAAVHTARRRAAWLYAVAGVVGVFGILLGTVILPMALADPSQADITIIRSSAGIEQHLTPFRAQLGADYTPYLNHNLRVLTYAQYFLRHPELTGSARVSEDDIKRVTPALELALAMHDIGLWSAAQLGYLEPSIAQANKVLDAQKADSDTRRLVVDAIEQHHKVTAYDVDDVPAGAVSKAGLALHVAVVEAVRRADWIDANKGLLTKDMPRANIAAVQAAVANAGFHDILAGFVPRIRGWNLPCGFAELFTIFRW